MAAKDKTPEVADSAPTHLNVRALKAGFRRAGRAWPAEEITVPLADFDDAQIAAIEGEPLLVVNRVAVAEDKPAK